MKPDTHPLGVADPVCNAGMVSDLEEIITRDRTNGLQATSSLSIRLVRIVSSGSASACWCYITRISGKNSLWWFNGKIYLWCFVILKLNGYTFIKLFIIYLFMNKL